MSAIWPFSILFRLRQRRARSREDVACGAADLIAEDADLAYRMARGLARAARQNGDLRRTRYWTRVALAIADRQGHAIGERVADRYEAARQARAWPRRG